MGRLFYLPESGVRIFCMYTKNKGVVATTPPGTDHIAHATYLNENAANPDNRSNIDHFLIRSDADESEIFGKDIQILHGTTLDPSIKNQNPQVDRRYGINLQVISGFRDLTSVIQRVTLTDVYRHMLGKKIQK